jgi:hypothetical protein
MTAENQKNLNDLNFKILVFMPLLVVAIEILIIIFIVKNNIQIERPESIVMLIRIILYLILFQNDRSLLRQKGAKIPAAGWFFIMPIYVFLRQKRNKLSLGYFGLYILNIIIGLIIIGMAVIALQGI